MALCLGPPPWASTSKGKINLDLLEQEIVCGIGISWAVCKSAPCSREIATPTSHQPIFLQAGCPSCTQPSVSKYSRQQHNILQWKGSTGCSKINFGGLLYLPHPEVLNLSQDKTPTSYTNCCCCCCNGDIPWMQTCWRPSDSELAHSHSALWTQ